MKISDVFLIPTSGIFGAIYDHYSETDPTWITSHEWINEHDLLDMSYIMERSGEKEVTPYVKKLIKMSYPPSPYLSDSARDTIARHIILRFGNKWDRLWAIVKARYNPIHNYDMEEIETPDIDKTHMPSADYAIRDVRTKQTDLTESVASASNTSLYGYNSPTSVPSDDEDASHTTRTTGAPESNRETSEHTETGSYTDHEGGERRLERRGNIGVTTTQQMMQSEINLWGKFTFAEELQRDLDKIMALPIY